MNKKLELLLVKKYPSIFKEYGGDMYKTCMAWGLECGDGWFTILNKACKEIQEVCDKYSIDCTAEQIKEKFGELRFYYSTTNSKEYTIKKIERYISRYAYKHRLGRQFNFLSDLRQRIYSTPEEKIFNIVRKAEEDSCKTCENCGEPGKIRGSGYVFVACDNCYKKET